IEKLDFGMMGDMAIGMVNKMSDKNASGIDFSGNAYFIAKHDEAFKFDYSYTYYSVTNRGKVYGTLKSSIGILIAGKHGSEGDYDTYHTERGTVGVWDNDHLVIVYSAAERGKEELIQIAKGLLDSRFVDALPNDRLTKFMALNDDVSCLIDLEKSVRMSDAESRLGTEPELLDAFNGGYLMGHGNFNVGEMVFSVDVEAPMLKKSKYNLFDTSAISRKLLELVNMDQSVGVGGANFKVDQLVELANKVEWKGQNVFSILRLFGINEGDLNRSLTGEIAFSLIDLKVSNLKKEGEEEDDFDDFFEEESYSDFLFDYKAEPQIIVGLKLANDAAFIELMNRIPNSKRLGNVLKVNDLYIVHLDGSAIVTTNLVIAQKVANGEKVSSTPLELSEDELSKPAYGFLNTNYASYSDQIQEMLNEHLQKSSLDQLWMAKKISASGNFDHFEIKIEMKDKSKNALGVFIEAFYRVFIIAA
ncbi:MAG: hypothetical protein JKY54_10725, partial [Flavobacteriales bacterium]|nr:hypothetical protein [Flavobacteriales bacterium]